MRNTSHEESQYRYDYTQERRAALEKPIKQISSKQMCHMSLHACLKEQLQQMSHFPLMSADYLSCGNNLNIRFTVYDPAAADTTLGHDKGKKKQQTAGVAL